MKKWVIIALFLTVTWTAFGQISGNILGEDKVTLPGAHILLLPDSIHTVSNNDGVFSFPFISTIGNYTLVISYIGHQSARYTISFDGHDHDQKLQIQLSEQSETLVPIVIKDEHAKQEMTLSTIHFDEHLMEQNLKGTFAQSIEQLPGISAINVGVGIAKPVIRGLSSNRIIVNQQGIKQESHQWGADHGLEVDQFDVERVEIVKGPASLQYGSDGLGGVINIMPGRIISRNSFAGSLEGVYKTNNQHWGGSGYLTANVNNFFIAARYSRQDFGDYKVPANQFEYNSFVLPLYNNRLKNTAGEESNFRISVGTIQNKSITRVLFSHYGLNAGLFAGAVGIPRSYALTEDGNIRDIDIPKQTVDHYRISLHHTYFLGNNHLNLNFGYQKNRRREFSFPEFHSIPSSQITADNTLALQLELQTWSANIHYEHKLKAGMKAILGSNVQYQHNQRGGFEFLLPDFQTFRAGGFSLLEWSPVSDWTLNGGVRLDYATNRSEFYRQWVWDSNENIIDSLIAPITDKNYVNWSASVGFNWHLGKDWWLRANMGKSFRVPYPSETVSNGIHHGTFRHEMGTPNLKSEQGYQFDISTDWQHEHFSIHLSGYFNYFNNYIYLGPTFPAQFSNLPEAGQVFQYRQDHAIYTGLEWQWNWAPFRGFSVEQVADYVQTYNTVTGLALPFTPQPALKHRLRYALTTKGVLEEWFIEVGHQYHFAAKGIRRVDRTERETPAYQLWQIGTGATLTFGQQEIQFNLQIQNLFNQANLNHLSRYRIINVPEQGRNIILTVKVPFSGRLAK